MNLEHLTPAQIASFNTRQAAAVISEAYRQAADLLTQIDRESMGSSEVIDMTGGTPRLAGAVEQHGHQATQPHHFTVPTTGDRKWRLDIAASGMWGAAIGAARAVERRDEAARKITATLADRARAVGIDDQHMFSGGQLTPMRTVADRLLDHVIPGIGTAHEGQTAELVRAAMALVPEDAFRA